MMSSSKERSREKALLGPAGMKKAEGCIDPAAGNIHALSRGGFRFMNQ